MSFNVKELQNIIDNLITEPWIKRRDKDNIIDMAGNFAYLTIHQNPMRYMLPDFHNILFNSDNSSFRKFNLGKYYFSYNFINTFQCCSVDTVIYF